jgi:hypothetical protein
VGSRNAMTLLTAASRGPRNGCYGDTRQLADLSVYLPTVQQVSRSAHDLADRVGSREIASNAPQASPLLGSRFPFRG